VDTPDELLAGILDAAQRNVKINWDEQHAIFADELQRALRLTVGFWNVYCELWQIWDLCVTDLWFKQEIQIKINSN
jgi:hypothetical protein